MAQECPRDDLNLYLLEIKNKAIKTCIRNLIDGLCRFFGALQISEAIKTCIQNLIDKFYRFFEGSTIPSGAEVPFANTILSGADVPFANGRSSTDIKPSVAISESILC